MFWRAWCFFSGLGPGALGALAVASLVSQHPDEPARLWVRLGALAGGLVVLLVAHLLDRRPQDEPDRGARFARAASAGLVAWPALALALLQLPPSPVASFLLVFLLLAAAFAWAARRQVPVGGLGAQVGAVLLAVLGGGLVLLSASALSASLGAEEPTRTDANRRAVFDHDATIDTVPLPECSPRASRVAVVHETGAHPRLDAEGNHLFYDAPGPEGRRQIHRMTLASGEHACLTCGEPGNNRRPAPSRGGASVAFDTDRHVSWRRPGNTELHLLNTSAALRGVKSRRITYEPGPDEGALFGPSPNTLAWSRGEGGRYRAVSGGLVSGHGSLQLGGVGTLAQGGADWLAPLAWSPDARALVFARGNPLGPARIDAVDPATESALALGESVAGIGGASFNTDGGWYVAASARRASASGLLPDAVSFAVAPVYARALADDAGLFQETEVVWGPTQGGGQRVDLGETAAWGAPTGISLVPDARSFYLGQRREGSGDAPEERIVHVELDCAG